MKTKISKAQLEVWDWKEQLSKELENIPVKEWLKYIGEKTKKSLLNLKKRKLRV